MKVLLVDDEKELVTTMAERLSFRGIEADWATSEEEVMKHLETKIYEIVVLDMKMPKVSGLKLKAKIEPKLPSAKFIFMTGHGSEEDYRAASMQAGSDFYLIKPVNLEKLIQKMNEAMGYVFP